jgi:hypothetical protein
MLPWAAHLLLEASPSPVLGRFEVEGDTARESQDAYGGWLHAWS